MANAAFDMGNVVRSVVGQAEVFIGKDSTAVAIGIYGLLFAFHVFQGAGELARTPSSCRLFQSSFWQRLILVGALLAGYKAIFVGTTLSVAPRTMLTFAARWAEVWADENKALAEMRQAEFENRDVKYTEVTASKAGKDDDSWYAKLSRYLLDGLYTGVGWIFASIAGLLITVLMLMEAFWALGMCMLLLAIGPACLAFGAHEKTEGIAWSWAKGFLVYGLIYMPMLGFACSFAGVVMARMTTTAASSGVTYGDGSDISVHMIMVVIGPLCALAVVRAVPSMLSSIIGAVSMGTGAGGTFDQAQSGARAGAAALTTGSPTPPIPALPPASPTPAASGPPEAPTPVVTADAAKEIRGEI